MFPVKDHRIVFQYFRRADFPQLLGIPDSLWRKVTFKHKDLGFATKLIKQKSFLLCIFIFLPFLLSVTIYNSKLSERSGKSAECLCLLLHCIQNYFFFPALFCYSLSGDKTVPLLLTGRDNWDRHFMYRKTGRTCSQGWSTGIFFHDREVDRFVEWSLLEDVLS